MTKQLPYKFHFVHIPREENKLADWLTLVPRTINKSIDIRDIAPNIMIDDKPPYSLEQVIEKVK